jgi:hypothetical protein
MRSRGCVMSVVSTPVVRPEMDSIAGRGSVEVVAVAEEEEEEAMVVVVVVVMSGRKVRNPQALDMRIVWVD